MGLPFLSYRARKKNGIITANSMAARGYGIGKRSSFTYFRWHTGDLILLLTSLLLSAAPPPRP